jgi:transcriptional regulator with XRE-family HTH domain
MPDTPGPWGQAQRDAWAAQREALGAFIRERRKQANLSLRQLAELTSLSNPYLSQIERGLHQPSVRVLRAISDALNLSAETLLAQAGLIDAMAGAAGTRAAAADEPGVPETERAIRADKRLTEDQKSALIVVYRSMLGPPGSTAS